MDHPGSITRMIRSLEEARASRRGDAVRQLWERFFADMTTYARRRLRSMHVSRGPADEEDAAERAFTKVCYGIERGQLRLANRLDLTRIFRSATAREVISLYHKASRGAGPSGDESSLGQVVDGTLPPDLLLLAFDACQRLLDLLESDRLRQVAVWKLAGHTNEAIALKLGCSLATVERTLGHIRETWRRTWVEAVPGGRPRPGPRGRSAGRRGQRGEDVSEDPSTTDTDEILRILAGLE